MSHRASRKTLCLALAVLSASVVLSTNRANAAADTWTAGVDANWSTLTAPTNWSGGTPPVLGDSLVFDDTGAAITSNTDDIVGLSVAGVTFNGGTAYNLGGSTPLTLTGAVTNSSTVAQVISLPLAIATNQTITSGSAGMTLSGNLADTSAGSSLTTATFAGTNGVFNGNFSTSATDALRINLGTAADTDTWSILGNNTSTLAHGQLYITRGVLNFGSASDAPTVMISARSIAGGPSEFFTVGSTAGGKGTFNMKNGILNIDASATGVPTTARFVTGNPTGGAQGEYNQTGGTVTLKNIGGGTLNANNTGSTGIITVSGGTLDMFDASNGSIIVATRGIGTMNISGTGQLLSSKTMNMARSNADAAGAVPTVNLDGGVLQVLNIARGGSAVPAAVVATFNFNGGTLKAAGASTSFLSTSNDNANFTFQVKAGGALIDSNTFNITAQKPLLHSAALGATPDGGLTKLGAGVLTLTGNNTYTGLTSIQVGSIAITSSTASSVIPNSSKILVGDTPAHSAAIFDVSGISFAGGYQLAASQILAGYGTVNGNATLATGSTLAPGNSAGTLTNTGSTALGASVALNYDLDVPDVLPGAGNNDLYAVSGTLTINPNLTLNVTPGPSFGPGTYHLITFSQVLDSSSSFSGWTVNGIDPSLTGAFNLTTNSLDLTISSGVPEPASLALLGVGTLALLARRRK